MIFKYKIHCNTESADEFWFLPNTNHPPTKCPNDSSHEVDLASVAVVDSGPGPQEVTTQYEKNDKDLKIACASSSVDGTTGISTITVKVPGSMAAGEGRYIAGGTAFFDVINAGDRVLSVGVVDVDGILGAGPNYLVKSYTDLEQESQFQGWFVPPRRGQLDVEPIGGYGFIPAQLYVQVVAQKVDSNKTGQFYLNLFWGKKE